MRDGCALCLTVGEGCKAQTATPRSFRRTVPERKRVTMFDRTACGTLLLPTLGLRLCYFPIRREHFFVCTDQKTWSCLRFVKSSRAHSGKTDPLQGCPAIVGGALPRCAARLNRHAVEIRSRVAEMTSEVKSVVGLSEPLDVRPDSARRANRVAALSKTNFNSLLTRVRIGASRSRYSQGRRVSWPMNQGPKVRRCR